MQDIKGREIKGERRDTGSELVVDVDYAGDRELWREDIDSFAKILQDVQYGYADLAVHGVYVEQGEDLVPVEYAVTGAQDFDPHSRYAHPTVTVTMPDGTTRSASYTIDGAA